jgi:transposase
VVVPVETAPGEVAQVDFGYVGKIYDGVSENFRKAWVFVMVLGYSRLMWSPIVFDQKVETWLELHVRAFDALGGVPLVLVPDNLKSAVIRAAFAPSDEVGLNRSYRELARHYGCKIDPTPPRAPEKKGKVESGVKYVKRNYVKPLDLAAMEIEEVRAGLCRWQEEIANARVHGTTGRVPREVFEAEEKEILIALPKERFEKVVWKEAKVHRDCHVVFEKRLYSAPWRLVGKRVWVRATTSSVFVYADEVRVATHARRGKSHRSTEESHLPEHRSDLRHRSRSYWEERADAIGAETGRYIREVFDSDEVLSQLRGVQAMVKMLEGYSRRRAEGACVRASFYGSYRYGSLKTILKEALDLQPLPTAVVPVHGRLAKPRFARTAAELLNQLEVKGDEYDG